MSVEELESELMRLPERERASLAHKLIESLEPEGADEDAEGAWEVAVRRRTEDLRAGKVGLVPGDEVFRRLQEDRRKP
jgi:putative addiction module component (TIGR02574 family)